MPANLVGPGEEKWWHAAKVSCKAKGYKGKRFWKCVAGTFKVIRRNAAKGGKKKG